MAEQALKLKNLRKSNPKENVQLEDSMGVSKYMYEQIAGGYDNQLPLSSICDAHCFF